MVKSKQKRSIVKILLCLIFGLALSIYYIFTSDFSFTILPQNHPASLLKGINIELTAGKKVTGSITPMYDNLGIIAIRFNTYNRENDDRIRFRIREKNASTWYNETEYRTTFGNNSLYNFGFPPIDHSAGNTYLFEIESLKGRSGNAVSVSTIHPILVSKYKYPKQTLLRQPTELYKFLKAKTLYTMANTDVTFATTVFLIPFLYSLMYKNKNKQIIATTILFVLMAVDTLMIKETRSMIIITICVMWYWFNKQTNKNSLHTFIAAITLLTLSPILYTIYGEHAVVKAATWAWLLLTIGIIFSLHKANKKHAYQKNNK